MIEQYNADNRDWYEKQRAAIKQVYGKDWRKFCKILAATSPNATITANLTLANKAYNQLRETGKIDRTGYIHCHYTNLKRCQRGQSLSGRKVNAFYRALVGHEDEVVVDIWMLRYAGYSVHNKRNYDEVEYNIRREADELGITPCQRQAEIWCYARKNSQGYHTELLQSRLF